MREDILIKGFCCDSTEACRDIETVVRMSRKDKTATCLECEGVWKMQTIEENRLTDTLARDKLLERLFKMDLSCGDLEWLAEGIMDEVACRMEE